MQFNSTVNERSSCTQSSEEKLLYLFFFYILLSVCYKYVLPTFFSVCISAVLCLTDSINWTRKRPGGLGYTDPAARIHRHMRFLSAKTRVVAIAPFIVL